MSETIDDIVREMRERSEAMEIHGTPHGIKVAMQEFADRIESAVKHKRESAEDVIREMGGCCSISITCGNCGKGEDIYFVPKGLITKLDSVIAHEKGEADEQ